MVEELLQTLVGVVDAKLLERVVLQAAYYYYYYYYLLLCHLTGSTNTIIEHRTQQNLSLLFLLGQHTQRVWGSFYKNALYKFTVIIIIIVIINTGKMKKKLKSTMQHNNNIYSTDRGITRRNFGNYAPNLCATYLLSFCALLSVEI